MAETKIEWTATPLPDGTSVPGYTFNAWTGCAKVSPACDHCYAESWAKRSGLVQWGAHPRRRTSESYWKQPIKWNRIAERDGVRRKVFCCSLADVFDNQAPVEWRTDLWRLIRETPNLDWLLLTKRPQNIAKMLPGLVADRPWPWPNVWLGTTVENQEEADRRIPHLLSIPAKIRFLSCEPLLGHVDLTAIQRTGAEGFMRPLDGRFNRIGWIICGGESGPNARPIHPDWARSLRNQCAISGVPFFFKQWGDYGPEDPSRKAEPLALADDGTLYRSADLAFPDGARYGEAIRANHDKAHLTMMYRVGKKAAGALLDGCQHREFP